MFINFLKTLLLCFTLFAIAWDSELTLALEVKFQEIYLEEPEEEPPAKVSRRRTKKDLYKDKSVHIERGIVQLSDGKITQDGPYVEFYRNGNKYKQGTFKMGAFHGKWQLWYPNGQLCKTINFDNGKADGQWEVFDKEGKRTASKSYQGGKRHGKWVIYYPKNEIVKAEFTYEQGTLSGERTTYYESGKKRDVLTFKEGKIDGLITGWYESGDKQYIAEYEAGKLVGEVQRFEQKLSPE